MRIVVQRLVRPVAAALNTLVTSMMRESRPRNEYALGATVKK